MTFFIIFLVFILISVVIYIKVEDYVLNTPPTNCTDNFLLKKNAHSKTIINIGDSLTHGVVSANYSKIIEVELSKLGFKTINAGINADLSITVLRRLDNILACKPTVATILLGTNDILASESEKKLKEYRKIKRILEEDKPSLDFFSDNILKIINSLKNNGVNHIYIISPPLIGEDINQPLNNITKLYSERIKTLAKDTGISYIPFNEGMREIINKIKNPIGYPHGSEFLNMLRTSRHYFLNQNIDELFKSNGYFLHTEGVHLNTKGAKLLCTLILKELLPQIETKS